MSKVNKFNPVTLAIRSALRAILALNFLGIATVLMKDEARSKEVLTKVKNMYKQMGGKEEKLMKTLNKAKSRKALFNKKVQKDMESGKFKGYEGLGSAVTIGSLLASAGAFLLKIWKWIKEKGIKVKDVVKKVVSRKKEKSDKNKKTNQATEEYSEQTSRQSTPNNRTVVKRGKTNDNTKYRSDGGTDDKKKNWKPIIITVGALSIIGGGLLLWNSSNKKKQPEPKKKLPETKKKKSTKLGTINFK